MRVSLPVRGAWIEMLESALDNFGFACRSL